MGDTICFTNCPTCGFFPTQEILGPEGETIYRHSLCIDESQRDLIAELVTALESMMRVADDYEQDIGEKLPAATMDRARAALAKAKEAHHD